MTDEELQAWAAMPDLPDSTQHGYRERNIARLRNSRNALAREVLGARLHMGVVAAIAREAVDAFTECDGAMFGDGSVVFATRRAGQLLNRLDALLKEAA